jgi:F-type H+-transporting ATPase subunit beta
MPEQSAQKTGRIIEIKGVVIDALFPEGLPEIYSALSIDIPERDGQEARSLIAEVQQHLGDDRLRAVAMDSTDGLARGLEVRDTGGPISVPVGETTLGRIWNVIGEPVDEKDARRRSPTCRRRSRCSRRGSRSSTCLHRSSAAARSACSAGRVWARPC